MRSVEDGHWWYAVLRRQVVNACSRCLPDGARILDAGCGTGGMMEQLSQRWACVGIDISPRAVHYTLDRGLCAVQGDVGALPFDNGSFDAVLCLDVIYHLAVDPHQALAEMRRVLKPGGLLILNVPAFSVLRGSHDQSVSGARRYKGCQVRALLTSHSFTEQMTHYWNAWLFVPLLLRRLSSRLAPGRQPSDLFPPPRWLNHLLSHAGHVDARACRALNLPLGTSFFAVATAPPDP